MSAASRPDLPPPLTVACALALLEAAGFGVLAIVQVVEFARLAERGVMNLSTTAFFVIWAGALAYFTLQVARRNSFGRAPLVLAQLIQLGLAWSFRGTGTTLVAIVLAVVAIVVIAGLLHPASVRALDEG